MYESSMKLGHNEKLVAVNVETGELRETRPNNIPEDKTVFKNGSFTKHYTRAWEFLELHLDNKEIGVVHKLIRRAAIHSNSLYPLSDETSLRILSKELSVGVNQVQKVKQKLLTLGVYASTSIMEDKVLTTYWLLNPYLAFNGRFPERTLVKLFHNTELAKYCRK